MPDRPAVLLVDDRPENLVALRAVLEPLPCRQVAVTSGEEALKALLNEDFAVVLLDVQMPGMDGFETAELIKGRERTRTLPIIFVTAISKERHHVFRGYSAGAVDYVFKPYDPSVLRSKVSVFLELDAKSRAAARHEALLRAAFDAAPIGMARLDLDGRIAEANRALAALVGHTPAELRDRLLETLVTPAHVDTVARARRLVASGGVRAGAPREVALAGRGGEEVPVQLHLSLARAAAGVPEAIVVQVEDLRERRAAEAEREQRLREHVAREQAERVTQRLQAIQRVSDAALGTLSFDDLVRELLERTIEALGVDTAAIVLHTDEDRLVIHQLAGGAHAERRLRVDPLDDEPLPPVLGDATAAALQAPLEVDGRQIGVLHVGSLFPRRFTPDDQALLALAADRAAIGIDRARLYQREHRIAEELQRSLLPAGLPELPGLATAARYFPAAGTQVGGDWYDTVVQPDGRLLLAIGDVAGRGIGAASMMGQLRSALRAYAVDGHGPASLLERLNAFQNGLRTRGMTTVAVVSVDPAGGELTYAKAGHPPPLLVQADGTPVWLDGCSGIPLGALDDATYSEATARLEPGATLVLYTDGLVELRGEPLDLGLERLRRATVDAPAEVDALCDAILAGTLANPDVDDDVTLLVLSAAGERRRPAPPAFTHRHAEGGRLLHAGTWPHHATSTARVELPGGRRAGAVARRALDEALGPVATRAELDDVRLVVAELVNNAVVHGGADSEDARVLMHVAAAEDVLRVEISNAGAPFEVRPPSGVDEPGGFGLVIVDQLTSRWGVDGDSETCVWFEIERVNGGTAAAPA